MPLSSMFYLFLCHIYFVVLIVKNRESKNNGRTERYAIETDHQLDLKAATINFNVSKLLLCFVGGLFGLFYNSDNKQLIREINRMLSEN